MFLNLFSANVCGFVCGFVCRIFYMLQNINSYFNLHFCERFKFLLHKLGNKSNQADDKYLIL